MPVPFTLTELLAFSTEIGTAINIQSSSCIALVGNTFQKLNIQKLSHDAMIFFTKHLKGKKCRGLNRNFCAQ